MPVWTNQSVLRLAGKEDPVHAITWKAQRLVATALDRGWKGPPFDPFVLAELQDVDLMARDDIRDARTVPTDGNRLRIEFNPNQPRSRVRYSIAHELGHVLFPDCAQHVRNRSVYHEFVRDEWQLEALCNVAAAELLMPIGSFPELGRTDLNIDRLLQLRRQYDVSTEALLIRTIRTTPEPAAMFCASRVSLDDQRFRLDYAIGSSAWRHRLEPGMPLPAKTAIRDCSAIGYTAKGDESWGRGLPSMRVECVALPPYTGGKFPRVAGVVSSNADVAVPCISLLRGDAMVVRGEDGRCLIAHVVNDRTPNWGGRGFAKGLCERWPAICGDFRDWANEDPKHLSLGSVRFARATPEITVASMVAQQGYGPSEAPRIRYTALQQCLGAVAAWARREAIPVQMPRIGTGYGGGSWEVIEELVRQAFCPAEISVTVYELPR